MSDVPSPDPDAWEQACAEDLAAERARQEEPGSAAEELRKLVDAVAGKVSELRLPLAGAEAVQQLAARAKAVVEPVIERNPEVFDHLAAAGGELLAAYRAAVQGQERRWTRGATGEKPAAGDGPGGEGGGTEHIDLD
ncbi:DUF5304 family protein [Streptomyces orinoci]|uniref:DUF5304 family protein n=1 Tax=Streptomyces orinoci TaxID=67339 RepID=A0ABV3JX39_STRON|nr:DUF5304 family protein [Streptomyces orinoci]